MVNERKQIGQALLKLRQKKKMTQDNIKVKSGLTPAQIVDLEKGRRDFRFSTLLSYLRVVDGNIQIK